MEVTLNHSEFLMQMLSVPALSRDEKHRTDFLASFLETQGIAYRRIHHNLLLGDTKAPGYRVLMNTHLDTVPPAEGWQTEPYTPLLEEGRIIALGSNDAGASVVSMLSTYLRMKDKLKAKINLMLLLSTEEEVSGSQGISAVLSQLDRMDAVIVGEPTGMQPAVAERGLMVIDAQVQGQAGHAGRNEGINAIYLAMEDLDRIGKMHFERPSTWLPAPSAQVTMIQGGSKHNVVPDRCTYVIDVRSNDCYSNEDIFKQLKNTCQASLQPRSMRLTASGLEQDHLLMQCIRSMDLQPFGSSTLSDMALIPFPAIKMGPGESARSHTAGEYIREEEIEEGVAIYTQFLEQLRDMI